MVNVGGGGVTPTPREGDVKFFELLVVRTCKINQQIAWRSGLKVTKNMTHIFFSLIENP